MYLCSLIHAVQLLRQHTHAQHTLHAPEVLYVDVGLCACTANVITKKLCMCCLCLQVRNRWAELSADEHQKITQLAYQHMKDGA
jgi:hypothetical protein